MLYKGQRLTRYRVEWYPDVPDLHIMYVDYGILIFLNSLFLIAQTYRQLQTV